MSVQENQTQLVIVQVTRCVDWDEHDRILKIGLHPPVVNYLFLTALFAEQPYGFSQIFLLLSVIF